MLLIDRLERIQISSFNEARRRIQIFKMILLALSVLVIIYSYVAYAERVSDKIYSTMQSDHYCGRRLNATHQMGCTSNLGGNLGVVWIIKQQKDLDHILKSGPTPPYVAVLRREHYTRKNLLEFKANPERVSGVVFFDDDHATADLRNAPFSPDYQCPNRYSGLYVNDTVYDDCKQNVWQRESPVSGLLYDDIPFPIFLINDKQSIQSIEDCFKENNVVGADGSQSTYPLCGIQLDSFMVAAFNTETCLNSHSFIDELLQSNGRRCYTVDNQNIFAYLKPAIGPLHPVENSTLLRPDSLGPQSVVMLIAKLSSLSMFTELSPGADSTITSIVTLLAVAEALGKVRTNSEVVKTDRNIVFALLDSEPFDYTGSNRMAYEMERNTFPNSFFRPRKSSDANRAMQNMNLSSIDFIINLDQLSLYPDSETIHLHTGFQGSGLESKLEQVGTIMRKVANREGVKFEQEPTNQPIPPASVQEFIKHGGSLPVDRRLMGLVLSNYGKTYSNLHYHSVYDDIYNIEQSSRQNLTNHIWRVANFVAKSLYELTFKADADKSSIDIDRDLIEQLLHCYLSDASCPMFTKAWQASQQLPKGPIQTYKDPIKKSDDMNGAITAHLLAYFIGEKVNELNLTSCYEENERSLIYNYQFANGMGEPVKDLNLGVCIKSQVQIASSLSPAFQVGENSIIVDRNYPAWTVSLNSIRNPVRLYLKPSPIYEWGIFLTGVITTAMAFVIVNHISRAVSIRKSETEFQSGTST